MSCTLVTPCWKHIFIVSVSSFTLSIHFFSCRHCSLLPQCNAFAGNRSLPILETCSTQVNLRRSAILSTRVLSCCRVLLTAVSFLNLSHLATLKFNSLLNRVISAVKILRLSSFLKHQHSEPYNVSYHTRTATRSCRTRNARYYRCRRYIAKISTR